MSEIFLVERAGQVRDILARGASADATWVALGPSAVEELDERGVDYRIADEFLELRASRRFFDDAHDRLRALCERLDVRLLAREPELRRLGMRPFLFHYFPLMVAVDAALRCALQLRAIRAAYPGRRLVIHRAPLASPGCFDFGFSNKDTLWGLVAFLPGWDGDFRALPEPPETALNLRAALNGPASGAILARMRRSLSVETSLRGIASGDLAAASSWLGRGRSLLVVGGPAEWARAVPGLRARGWRVLFAEYSRFDRAGKGGLPLEVEELEDPLFSSAGVDLLPLLRPRITGLAAGLTERCLRAASEFSRVKERHDVRAVLASYGDHPSAHLCHQAARSCGVPVLLWQHGFVCRFDRISQSRDLSDLLTVDRALVYGESAREAYAASGLPASLSTTGSAALDGFSRERAPSGRDRLLFVTTNYYRNGWYYGVPPGFTDTALCRDQRVIIEALLNSGAKVTIKLHPAEKSAPWLRAALRRGAALAGARSTFAGLLNDHDAVVVDYPSTTLLQAAASRHPVFSLMRHWSYPAPALELLRRRVVCSDEAGHLGEAVRLFVRDGAYPADVEDRAFLREYGTGPDDGRSAERAAAVVEEAAAAAGEMR